jgi:hypothetical protein
MIDCVCSTCPVQPNEFVICMGTDMETCSQLDTQSLLPAERLAITAHMGALLIAIGSLLQEHPDLRAGLAPETGQLLTRIGGKLSKAATDPGAW